ncbi:esterase-like activity of phytase family protein [Paracoccus aminophilus]|uniref:Phytase-like domain-containing protein n=1 Tax=Paracoccus aminophilus JCM 7686 TaxID=1367847 RepID=S5XQT7_PARAH|nr:esterase-like activity of phytase family protein [Paracoccus aminophilus]AGT07432.1 hypothetical protein JCM7686_0323 [Paracoccus aminophilus JCM 7686]
MSGHSRRTLTGRFSVLIAFCVAAAALLTAAATYTVNARGEISNKAEYIGTYVWHEDAPDFGGYSGIELTEDGRSFMALSDRATLRWGEIERDAEGRISGMVSKGMSRLHDSQGRPLPPGHLGDSEGIAIDSEGRIYVSFEGLVRVARYDTPDAPAKVLKGPPEFKQMQRNSALESLAITPDGTLLTMPERSGALDRPFPVWRWRKGVWDQPFSVSRNGNWLPVGSDIGPDGKFYLLERDFKGLLGFLSRVRRFDLTDAGLVNEEILLQSYPMQYDNLEGIAVWKDDQGIRLTMISDDNFYFLQRTELVEYRIRD